MNVRILFEVKKTLYLLETYFENGKTSFYLNDIKVSKNKIKNYIDVLIVTSRVINDIRYSKQKRIKEFERMIKSLFGVYGNLSNEFNKINKFIKNNFYEQKISFKYLEVLEKIQSEIIKFRKNFIDLVNKKLEVNSKLFIGEKIKIEYCENHHLANSIFDLKTIDADDFLIKRNNNNLYEYYSEGEIKISIFLLYLSVLEIVLDEYDKNLILMIDDAFSELDYKNQEKIIDILKIKNESIFITTTNESIIRNFEKENFKVIYLKNKGDKNE